MENALAVRAHTSQPDVVRATPLPGEWLNPATLQSSLRRPARLGLLLVVMFFGAFVVWSALVPISAGAVAPGIISPNSSKKTVQHLEGGIIRRLHVRDGDVVAVGQPLLTLESVQSQATFDVHSKQKRTLLITKARLEAEKTDRTEIDFPAEIGMDTDPETLAAIAAQRDLFETRRASHRAQKQILQQRIAQLKEQIKGFEAQITSASRQLTLIADEITGKDSLLNKGLLAKPEFLKLQRMEAEIMGQRGEYVASVAQAQQRISETEGQLIAADAERADKIAVQADEVETQLAQLEEKLLSSEDILRRTVVTAPVAGTIFNLQFKTEGGVVRAGDAILDIVPLEDKLIIEARISPTDIDVVHAGLKAQVQLSAFSGRSTPRVDGLLRSVSADRIVDEKTGQPYFLARVEVDRDALDEKLGPNHELVPGMPAEALIVTGERTLGQYLLQPFLDAIWKTFREV